MREKEIKKEKTRQQQQHKNTTGIGLFKNVPSRMDQVCRNALHDSKEKKLETQATKRRIKKKPSTL